MLCQRYIELNPVRASLVTEPARYPWSSYHHNALGYASKLIRPHELYGRLGHDPASRQRAYRALFEEVLGGDHLDLVRKAIHGKAIFGSPEFTEQSEQLLQRAVARREIGRPRKQPL
jgi:putative transposase